VYLSCRFKTEDWKINNYEPDGSKHSEMKKRYSKAPAVVISKTCGER
jgi:hypothetical protein